MRVDAVLPAGGRISGEFADEAGTEIKSLIRFGGRTILERTLDALRSSERIGRIVVIGPEELAGYQGMDAVLPEVESGIDNIYQGIQWLYQANGGRHADRVLIITTDLPFLDTRSIVGFLDACPPGGSICLPLVSRSEFEKVFPGAPNFFVRLRDGVWTIGCAFLADPEMLVQSRALIENVFAMRKSRVGMARLLGLPFIVRYLTRRLGVPDIEARCQKLLGCSASGVRGCPAELSYDIDLPDEFRYAVKSRNWEDEP